MLHNRKLVSIELSEPKLKQRNRALSFLIDLSNFLATPMEPEELLEGALSMVLEHFSLKFGRIYLMDDDGKTLSLAAHRGIETTGLEKVHISEGFTGKAARTKSFIAQYVSQLESKKRAALLADKGVLVSICMPLISRGKVEGVMNLSSSEIIDLDQEKIDLLTTVGNQLAVAANSAKLHADLKSSVKTLKEKRDMIKFFTYSVAHDLKSPAIGVYGLTRLLQEKYAERLDERGQTYCRKILKTSEQMVVLVEKLNAFISTKESPMNFEKIKTKEVTEGIKDEVSYLLKERGVIWSEAGKFPEIVADRLALSRAFRNFVDNALKHGGENLANIRIEYEERPGCHVFSFSDDGDGIEEKDREKVFDCFQRNGSAKGVSGSGLGLAIIKEVAEKHGGRVWLDPETTRGATFHMTISKDLTVTA